jgi:hypothetical protein
MFESRFILPIVCVVFLTMVVVGGVVTLWLPPPPTASPSPAYAASVSNDRPMRASHDKDPEPRLGGNDNANVDCSVTCWFSSPCNGDCWNATREQTCAIVHTNTGSGTPCPPLVSNVDCNDTMPCVCLGSDLTAFLEGRSITTCTDCTLVAPGNACFLVCENTSLTMQGVPEATCVNGTWAWAGLPATCVAALASCPTIQIGDASAGCLNSGVVLGPTGICSNAREGDVCNISCMSGYSIPSTDVVAGATSSAYCVHGSWSSDPSVVVQAQLTCRPQAGCAGSAANGNNGDTCAPGGSCQKQTSGGLGQGWARGSGQATNIASFAFQ